MRQVGEVFGVKDDEGVISRRVGVRGKVVREERVAGRQVDFKFAEKVADGFRGRGGGTNEDVSSVIDKFNEDLGGQVCPHG